jgi:biotin carboxyl carrier protein
LAALSDDLPMSAAADLPVLAPFAGVVVALPRVPEDAVGAGSALIVLEAMKMEHTVRAPVDGVIATIAVTAGDQVESGQVLAVVSDEGDAL